MGETHMSHHQKSYKCINHVGSSVSQNPVKVVEPFIGVSEIDNRGIESKGVTSGVRVR